MNKRHYQLFALSILVGAPLLISLLSNAIPALQGVATVAPAEAAARPDYETPSEDPMASLPPELAPPLPEAQNGPQANGAFTAAPSLDTSGMAISGTDPAIAGIDPAASAPALDLPSGDGGTGLTEEEMIARQVQSH